MKIPNLRNRKLAEFVGILLGDGSITRTYQNRIQITLNKNEILYAKYIQKLITEIFDIDAKIKFRKTENALDIHIFKRKIIDFLLDGVGLKESPKWNRQIVPKIFLNNYLEKLILRGYFDTDGSVVILKNGRAPYPRLEMKICPSPMRNSLIKILKRQKFHFGNYLIENGRTRIQLNGRTQAKRWMNLIGISNPLQLERLQKIAL
jgi:DNA-binding transcriptional regulator WhiA